MSGEIPERRKLSSAQATVAPSPRAIVQLFSKLSIWQVVPKTDTFKGRSATRRPKNAVRAPDVWNGDFYCSRTGPDSSF